MTQRIEIFERKKDSKNWIFSKIYSKNWTLCFEKRIEELNSFLFDVTQRIELFFCLTQRIVSLKKITRWIEPSFEYVSMNWIFFSIWLKDLSLSHNMTFKNWTFWKIWLKALNPFFQYDSKNWTLFWTWLTETFLNYNSKNCFLIKYDSQRIEPSFHKWFEDLNFLFQICLIELNLFWKKRDDSKTWFSENINQII